MTSQASVTLYRQLMRRNREIEGIIRMLMNEQVKNGKKVLALVLKYPEVSKVHKRRK